MSLIGSKPPSRFQGRDKRNKTRSWIMAVTLQDVAKEVKAAVEIIDAISELVEDAARSVVIEINNATSQTLRRIRPSDGDGHAHGSFQSGALPKETIEPFQSDVYGSTSSAGTIGVGTEGNVWYDVDGQGTRFLVRWVLPFVGSNESGAHTEGTHADFYQVRHIISGGNDKVRARYAIGENAAIAMSDPNHYRSDWRTCGKCKALFFALDPGTCPQPEGSPVPLQVGGPGVVLGPHEAAGYTFKLLFGVPGPNREGGWRKCRHCKELFFDGFPRKGVCAGNPGMVTGAAPDGTPIHSSSGHVPEGDSPDFLLAFDMPPRPWQQNDWRFCDKCLGLFYLPHNADADCPAGGIHHAHPFNYVLDRA
jgi:hypothetical protein